jgi:hypothetical protein
MDYVDYAANRQRSRSPIPLELNPVYKSNHVSRRDSDPIIIAQPIRNISNERINKTEELAPNKSAASYEPILKNEKYEYSYQRYQDKNYDFMNKKIGDSEKATTSKFAENYSTQKHRNVKFDNEFEEMKSKTFD